MQIVTIFLGLVIWSKVLKICGRDQDVFSSVSEVASAQVTEERRTLGASRGNHCCVGKGDGQRTENKVGTTQGITSCLP